MKTRIKSSAPSKKERLENLEARKTQLDYMCTYVTWLTIKERYMRELSAVTA
jgi:hypothetical protein